MRPLCLLPPACSYRRSLLRRCLCYWRHVLWARRLLHRVFSTAELLWEEYTDTLQT